ncbi:MAG: DUF2164 domain-containing protein [Variovorax sp.]|nr:MAG: DUF2164 domain-containing protein [Variovorax sp.]
MAIELKKETQAAAVASIERWFTEEVGERIGNLQAAALLDFFLKEVGPSIYNQAIADAQQQLMARVGEIDIECHESEFAFWNAGRRRGT